MVAPSSSRRLLTFLPGSSRRVHGDGRRGDADAAADPHRWWALIVIVSAMFMALVDVFIVNVAAPSIQADLHATNSNLELVLTGYTLIYGVGLVLGSRLGDRFGQKEVFLAGMSVFTGASLACGLAPSVEALIVSRLVQGAGSALMVPQVFSFIQTTFSPSERPKALGVYGAAAGLASVVGHSIGGALIGGTDTGSSWRLVFFVNVPVGVVAISAGVVLLRRTRRTIAGGWNDVVGALLLAGALIGLSWPLIRASAGHWPGYLWPSEVGGAVALALFVVWEASRKGRRRLPLLDPRLLKRPSMAFGSIGIFLLQGALAAFLFVFALYFQNDRGYSPQAAGLLLVAPGFGYAVASLAVAKLTRTKRPPLVAGSIVLAVAYGVLSVEALAVHDGPAGWVVVFPMLALGLAMGFVFTPLINRATVDVPLGQAGEASGVISTSIQLANLGGVAIVGTMFLRWRGSGAHPHPSHAFAAVLLTLAVTSLVAAGTNIGVRRAIDRTAASTAKRESVVATT